MVLVIPNIHVVLLKLLKRLLAQVNYLRNQKYLDAFGQNVKRLRNKKGLSQEKLALEMDVDYMQVYRIEHGKVNTTISTVLALARALGVPTKELLDFDFKG